jgi:hypothetical protein
LERRSAVLPVDWVVISGMIYAATTEAGDIKKASLLRDENRALIDANVL